MQKESMNMTDKTDDIRSIQNIENKYGLVPFRMGLTHLVDVGHRNLGSEEVEEGIKQILAQGEEDKDNGKRSFMTPEFQCEILRCAAELAQFSPWTLFCYIKKHVVVEAENEARKPDAGICPVCRDKVDYNGGEVEETSYVYNWKCEECGVYGRDYYDLEFSESIVDGEV